MELSWTEEQEIHVKEVQYQTALTFAKYLNKLLKNTNNDFIQLNQKALYENFEYPDIAYNYHVKYSERENENYVGDEQAHRCALLESMIYIDESSRPNKYYLTKEFQSGIILRPYQKSIINSVKKSNGSVLIEAPTGAGKSVIASNIAKNEAINNGKVLIVAPKIILLEQLQETFKELNPQIIHGKKDYDNKHNVFISTVQTAHKRDLGFEPTMILVDEVHVGFDGKMINQLLEDFEGRLIGLSATPYDKKGLVLKGFDNHIDYFDLDYMIKYNYLHHPQCFSPIKVDLSNISIVAGDYNQDELDKYFNTDEDIFKIIESTKEFILKRDASLIFCININHAIAVAAAFNDSGVPTKAIHSKLSRNEQKEIMNDFKSGKLKLLANPMILTTGFDYPATDTIILARPTKSQNLFRQMVGRGLRLSENKKDAVVLDCSGVISNLGLPSEKIKEVTTKVSQRVPFCDECGSERVYQVIKNKTAIKKCADCGDESEVNQKGYECSNCSFINTYDLNFFVKNENLYLKCNHCGEDFIVSKKSSTKELEKIFDEAYINSMQKNTSLKYISYLVDKKSAKFLTSDEAISHLKALLILITKYPELFIEINTNKFNSCVIIEGDNGYEWHYDGFSWSIDDDKDDWRIFDESIENKLLFSSSDKLLLELEESNSFNETIKIIQSILKTANKDLIEENLIIEVKNDIKNSSVENIDSICNKRIKDIFFKGEDFESMKGFVEMMEKVL